MPNRRTHNIYVIKLDRQILIDEQLFKNANPDYIDGNPCVYVGMTSKSPAERFQEHRLGHHCSPYARKYGKSLMFEVYGHLNPMTKNEAAVMERQMALKLRDRGWAAWYN